MTLEEFAVEKMKEKDEKIKELEKDKMELANRVEELWNILTIFMNRSEIKNYSSYNCVYIANIDDYGRDKKDFERIVNFFNLKEEEENK